MRDAPLPLLSSLQGESRQMSRVQASKPLEVQGKKEGRTARGPHCVPAIRHLPHLPSPPVGLFPAFSRVVVGL